METFSALLALCAGNSPVTGYFPSQRPVTRSFDCFFDLQLQLWVLGMRCLHLPVRALSKVLLLPVWVWLVLPSTAYSKGMLPLDLWCQASLPGLPERQHLGKTVQCWGWSDRIVSWVLWPWRRGWEICTEWGLVAQRLITDSCPVVTGHKDPQRSPCWLPTTVVSAWSGRRGGGTWQWPTGSMSSSVMSRDSNFTR